MNPAVVAANLASAIAPSAIAVALPELVTGPVKLAFVITVAAKLPVPEPVTPPVSVIVWSPVLVPLEVPEKVHD